MGNLFFKNRTNKQSGSSATNSSSFNKLCPHGLRKKNFWGKHVLETSAPVPKNEIPPSKNEWQSATLNVPVNKVHNENDSDYHPVAPPRKKRSSTLQKNDKLIRNGFEDVFIGAEPNAKSKSLEIIAINSNNNDEIDVNDIKKKSSSLTRKVSKVGNKKSDKFFGENLSDCLSDETVEVNEKTNTNNTSTIETDLSKCYDGNHSKNDDNENSSIEIDKMLDIELSPNIKKEKGELMFSIENYLNMTTNKDDDRFKDEIPVEEELIVPVKKVRRHICDDDDKMHEQIYNHNHNINDSSTSIASPVPKKPQRDLAKYKKAIIDVNEIESPSKNEKSIEQNECIDKVTQQATVVIEEILKDAQAAATEQSNSNDDAKFFESKKAKIQPELEENTLNLIGKASIIDRVENAENILDSNLISRNSVNSDNDKNIKLENNENLLKLESINDTEALSQSSLRPQRTSEIIPPNLSNSEKILRRCLSTQSYLTSDLIEKIALQANILSMPGGFSPEDALQCNDGSGLVSPNFKLEQKRSLNAQLSTGSSDIIENEIKDNSQKIDFKDSNKNSVNDKVTSRLENTLNRTERITVPTIEKIDISEINEQNDKQSKLVLSENEISSKPSLPKSIKPIEILSPNIEIKTKKEMSETLKEFLKKKDLKSKEILDLLYDEFGDCIFSNCLDPEDKRIIDDLKSSVNQEKTAECILTPTQIKTSIKLTKQISNDEVTKSPGEKQKCSKIPILKNKNLENISFTEKRRHSIDDLNAWFSPEKDFPIRKRKREASLPGNLENQNISNIKRFDTHLSRKANHHIERLNEENNEKAITLAQNVSNKSDNKKRSIENIFSETELAKDVENKNCNNSSNLVVDNLIEFKKSSEVDDHSALLKFLEHEKSNFK